LYGDAHRIPNQNQNQENVTCVNISIRRSIVNTSFDFSYA